MTGLKCNLISLGQLMDEANYFNTLFDNLCIVQDCISRMMIGVSERKDRIFLYKLLHLLSHFTGSISMFKFT